MSVYSNGNGYPLSKCLYSIEEFNRIRTRVGKSGERVQRALVIGKNNEAVIKRGQQ